MIFVISFYVFENSLGELPLAGKVYGGFSMSSIGSGSPFCSWRCPLAFETPACPYLVLLALLRVLRVPVVCMKGVYRAVCVSCRVDAGRVTGM